MRIGRFICLRCFRPRYHVALSMSKYVCKNGHIWSDPGHLQDCRERAESVYIEMSTKSGVVMVTQPATKWLNGNHNAHYPVALER